MTATGISDTALTASRNEVILHGRVAAPVDERELPSGDTIITARLIVDRDTAALARSSQRVDTLDCVAWVRRVQRSMRSWRAGDRVEVSGAIRRRFYQAPGGAVSRVEVEIRSTRRLARGGDNRRSDTS
jgi:single-strand DNA-binding protein